MAGKFFVIDGTDGSGKATQTRELKAKLEDMGHTVKTIDFPHYKKPPAKYVEAYLRGEFGEAAEVSPWIATVFYAYDRFCYKDQIQDWLDKGYVVLADRYVSANQGHQAGKIRDPKERERIMKFIEIMEYEAYGIPRPDKVLFLHVPVEVSQKLANQAADDDKVKACKRDIHEKDTQHLIDAEKSYVDFCKQNSEWELVSCVEDGQLLSIDAIHSMVMDAVNPVLDK